MLKKGGKTGRETIISAQIKTLSPSYSCPPLFCLNGDRWSSLSPYKGTFQQTLWDPVDHQTPAVCFMTFSLNLDSGTTASLHINRKETRKRNVPLVSKDLYVAYVKDNFSHEHYCSLPVRHYSMHFERLTQLLTYTKFYTIKQVKMKFLYIQATIYLY